MFLKWWFYNFWFSKVSSVITGFYVCTSKNNKAFLVYLVLWLFLCFDVGSPDQENVPEVLYGGLFIIDKFCCQCLSEDTTFCVSLSLWILANINSATTVIYIFFFSFRAKSISVVQRCGPDGPSFRYVSGNQNLPRDKWTWKYNNPKSMGHNKKSSKRELYYDISLLQEMKKISSKQLNLVSKGNRERTTNKSWSL